MLISAADLIKQSYHLYRANLGLFIKYVIASYIPGIIITVAGVFLGGAAGILFFADKTGGATIAVIVLGLLILAAFVASIWVFLAFIRVIAARYLGKETEAIKLELKKALPLVLPYIGATILFGLIMVGGAILFIIPAVIFSIWFSFYFYEIALDNKGVMDALKGSKALVRGRWWGMLWRLAAPAFLFGVIAYIAQLIVQFPLGTVIQNAASTGVFLSATIISALLSAAINVLLTPLTIAAQTILYIEAKNTPVATPPAAPSQPTAPQA